MQRNLSSWDNETLQKKIQNENPSKKGFLKLCLSFSKKVEVQIFETLFRQIKAAMTKHNLVKKAKSNKSPLKMIVANAVNLWQMANST